MRKQISARQKSRKFVLQALYKIELTEASVAEATREFLEDHNMKNVDTDHFEELLKAVTLNKTSLDERIAGYIDRNIKELGSIELSILRMGALELRDRPEVPYKVVINEYIEIARQFGSTDDSYKYVNSILDRLAREFRELEVRKSG